MIEDTMPTTNPSACAGECADHIAQYMLDAFWDDTLGAKPVSGASAGHEAFTVVANGDIESGVTPWYAFGDTNPAVAQSTAQVHAGLHSLMVYDRGAATDGAGQALSGLVAGQTYQITVWVRLNSGDDTVTLRAIIIDDAPRVIDLAAATVSDDGWTAITGTYQHSPQGEADVSVVLDGPAEGAIFYVDDLSVVTE